jgi:hypothetical protein
MVSHLTIATGCRRSLQAEPGRRLEDHSGRGLPDARSRISSELTATRVDNSCSSPLRTAPRYPTHHPWLRHLPRARERAWTFPAKTRRSPCRAKSPPAPDPAAPRCLTRPASAPVRSRSPKGHGRRGRMPSGLMLRFGRPLKFRSAAPEPIVLQPQWARRLKTRWPPITAGRRAFSPSLSITQRDAVHRRSPMPSVSTDRRMTGLFAATEPTCGRWHLRPQPLGLARAVCGRSAHPLAAPTQILMRSSDPGGWPNLTQRVAVEPLAERE